MKSEKMSKYVELEVKVSRMQGFRSKIAPIIPGNYTNSFKLFSGQLGISSYWHSSTIPFVEINVVWSRDEIEKRRHLKITTEPVIVVSLGIIKKGQLNTLTYYLAVPAYIKYKKLHFAELLIFFEQHNQCEWYHTKYAGKYTKA